MILFAVQWVKWVSYPKNDSLCNDRWRHRTWRQHLTGHQKWKGSIQTTGRWSFMTLTLLVEDLQAINSTLLSPKKSWKLKKPLKSKSRADGGTLNMNLSLKTEIWNRSRLQKLVVRCFHWPATRFIFHPPIKSINVFSKLVDFLDNSGTVNTPS